MAGEEQWRRFEREATGPTGGTKFWAIRVEGASCVLRHGLVGADEHSKTIELASAAEARAQHKNRIRTKLRAGWVEVEVGAGGGSTEDAELEAQLRDAIAANPSDLDAWMVYGDFLAQRVPLLGERLTLGIALARTSDRRARRRIEGRIQQLESAHARELLGPTIAGLLGERRFEGAIDLDRRLGMILGAQVHDRPGLDWRFEAVIGSLLEIDAAAILVDLGIHGGSASGPFKAALELLLAEPRPSLARLRLDYGQVENSVEWRRGNFREQIRLPRPAQVTAGLPNLTRFELVGPFNLERWNHAKLRELVVRRVGVVAGVSLAGCELPALERLQLADTHGCSGWAQAELPALRELLINVPGQMEPLLRGLLDSSLLDRLEVLAVIATSLHESSVNLMCEHGSRFEGLRRLIVVDPPFRPGITLPLERRFPNCEVTRSGPRMRGRSARVLVEYDFDGRPATGKRPK